MLLVDVACDLDIFCAIIGEGCVCMSWRRHSVATVSVLPDTHLFCIFNRQLTQFTATTSRMIDANRLGLRSGLPLASTRLAMASDEAVAHQSGR